MRLTSLVSVLLPEPVCPTIATVCPASARKERSLQDRLAAVAEGDMLEDDLAAHRRAVAALVLVEFASPRA